MMDVVLLMVYGVAGTWVWRQRRPEVDTALGVGAQIGLVLGAVHIANHHGPSFWRRSRESGVRAWRC
jgi:hypothetical protein